jgi:hypothetical protein
MKWFAKIVLFGALSLGLAGCLAGTSAAAHVAADGWLAQLILGFWHGLIAPLTFSMAMFGQFFPKLMRALPYSFWGPWYAYDGREAGFAYNMGYCFGLFLIPSFLIARPKILL